MRGPSVAQRGFGRLARTLEGRGADVFAPSGASADRAARGVRTLAVGAHPDDLECLALGSVLRGARAKTSDFAGVVLTNGAGCARAGAYGGFSDARMARLRRAEQRRAAAEGRYALLVQLGLSSRALRGPGDARAVDALEAILKALRPREVLTHDLADRHATHAAAALRVVEAARRLPARLRPARLLGFEVWRSLDWLPSASQVRRALPGPLEGDALGLRLLRCYPSQLAERRYDLGLAGRHAANAVFGPAPAPRQGVAIGMDLTPLLRDARLEPEALLRRHLAAFEGEVLERLGSLKSKGGRS